MEYKEYRTIKARIAYQKYIEQLPKCDDCPKCLKFDGRNERAMRVCLLTHKLIEGKVQTSPEFCPFREGV